MNCKIKNLEKTKEIIASTDWEIDIDMENNPGQINSTLGAYEYYDAERDVFDVV